MVITIDTNGAYIHVKDGLFEVILHGAGVNGNDIKKTFSPKNVNTLLINNHAAISGTAVTLALFHNIDIIFLDNYSEPMGRVWYPGLGSTTKIRKAQLIASLSKTGFEWVKIWLTAKIENRVELLKRLKKHRAEKSALLDDAIHRMTLGVSSIKSITSNTTSDVASELRGIEGSLGKIYFDVLSEITPKDFAFNGRSYRPAKDLFNAFLNYSYGILYSRVEKALIIAGIDPYLGFLHRDDYNMLSMVFDFVEPYRVYCEEIVFKLFSQKKASKKNADTVKDGVFLNKEGKTLLMEEFTAAFEVDKVKHKSKNQTIDNIIRLEAHAFAQSLLKTEGAKNSGEIIKISEYEG